MFSVPKFIESKIPVIIKLIRLESLTGSTSCTGCHYAVLFSIVDTYWELIESGQP